jgi:D-serine dehydratase
MNHEPPSKLSEPGSPLDLEPILATPIPQGTKGLPPSAAGRNLGTLKAQGYNVLAGDIALPACLLRRDALDHNRKIMREFTTRMGVQLAPHGKTTMAPQLFAKQFADGAWGLTAGTPAHLFAYRSVRVPRILYANQLIDPHAIDFVAEELAADDKFEFLCLVDSRAAIDLLLERLQRRSSRPVDVLIEFGIPGARTGVRRIEESLALAAYLKSCAPIVRLRGIEAFEGVVAPGPDGVAGVRALLSHLAETLRILAREDAFAVSPPILSAGGSAYFGMVAEHFRASPVPVQLILRSGCYLTHDHGMYRAAHHLETSQKRLVLSAPFKPAIEVWAHIQSTPEPGLVIATLGKRDISYDVEMPIPIKWARRDTRAIQLLGAEFKVESLNDQHARMRAPVDHGFSIGDRVAFGCSHPCTTFDKWKTLLEVDDDYNVVDVIATLF